MFYFIIVLALFIFFVALYFMKIPKLGNLILVTGGVKCGKTTLAVRLCVKQLKKQRRKVWLYNHIVAPLKKAEKRPKPLLYSNIPLTMEYVPVSREMLTRDERFVYGSVIYLCEASLVADSQLIKDYDLNEQLLLFNKLIGHETRGGYLIYDTQSISDNHYTVKRSLSQYLYIHHLTKLPFFCIAWVKELMYSDDNSTININKNDAEEGLQYIIIPKKTWKLFDCYCYSALTDHLPCIDKTQKATSRKELKATKIVSFRKFKKLFGGNQNVQNKDNQDKQDA